MVTFKTKRLDVFIIKLNQYCTQMRAKNSNYIPDPFDWEAWQI